MTVLAEPLTRLLGEQAPGCSVSFDSVPPSARPVREPADAPRPHRGAARLRLPRPDPAGLHRRAGLRGRPRPTPTCATAHLTLDDLQAMPHAVAEFLAAGDRSAPAGGRGRAEGRRGPDRARAGDQPADAAVRGRRHRHVRVRAVPAGAALPRTCSDLVIAETPLRPGAITEAAHWHPRREQRPGRGVAAPAAARRGGRVEDAARPTVSRTPRSRLAVNPRADDDGHHHRGDDRGVARRRGRPAARPRRRARTGRSRAPRCRCRRRRAPATIASAAALPMIPPLLDDRDEDRNGVGPRRRAAPAASATSVSGRRHLHERWQRRTIRRGSTRSTSRLTTAAGGDQPDRVDAERDAVLDLGEPEHVLVHERRGGDVGHHHREREREDATGEPSSRERAAPAGARARYDALAAARRADAAGSRGPRARTPTSITTTQPGDRPEHPAPADRAGAAGRRRTARARAPRRRRSASA